MKGQSRRLPAVLAVAVHYPLHCGVRACQWHKTEVPEDQVVRVTYRSGLEVPCCPEKHGLK